KATVVDGTTTSQIGTLVAADANGQIGYTRITAVGIDGKTSNTYDNLASAGIAPLPDAADTTVTTASMTALTNDLEAILVAGGLDASEIAAIEARTADYTVTFSGTAGATTDDSVELGLKYIDDTATTKDANAKLEWTYNATSKSGSWKYNLATGKEAGRELYRKEETDLTNKAEAQVYTPNKGGGLALVATTAGVDNQISGLTINITDKDGNVRKDVNSALDKFTVCQGAENKTGDQALSFQVGADSNVSIKVGLSDMSAYALGLKGMDNSKLSVATKDQANAAINVIENALTRALDEQTKIGAIESRLEYTSSNLIIARDDDQASESVIRDADMAKEMTNYTKNNVLVQTAQAMLAHANQSGAAVLSLLR
ncbi:MAG: hypothetical protein K6G55_00030, partial [Selenomonadaceae bacterium]|nr:hypothetical protein [Selenomonadaceae bacterium]